MNTLSKAKITKDLSHLQNQDSAFIYTELNNYLFNYTMQLRNNQLTAIFAGHDTNISSPILTDAQFHQGTPLTPLMEKNISAMFAHQRAYEEVNQSFDRFIQHLSNAAPEYLTDEIVIDALSIVLTPYMPNPVAAGVTADLVWNTTKCLINSEPLKQTSANLWHSQLTNRQHQFEKNPSASTLHLYTSYQVAEVAKQFVDIATIGFIDLVDCVKEYADVKAYEISALSGFNLVAKHLGLNLDPMMPLMTFITSQVANQAYTHELLPNLLQQATNFLAANNNKIQQLRNEDTQPTQRQAPSYFSPPKIALPTNTDKPTLAAYQSHFFTPTRQIGNSSQPQQLPTTAHSSYTAPPANTHHFRPPVDKRNFTPQQLEPLKVNPSSLQSQPTKPSKFLGIFTSVNFSLWANSSGSIGVGTAGSGGQYSSAPNPSATTANPASMIIEHLDTSATPPTQTPTVITPYQREKMYTP